MKERTPRVNAIKSCITGMKRRVISERGEAKLFETELEILLVASTEREFYLLDVIEYMKNNYFCA